MSDFGSMLFESHLARALEHDGAFYFALADVRSAIGIKRQENVAGHLGEREYEFFWVHTAHGWKREPAVNLFGLCTIAALGERAVAQRFVRWVVTEAVPLILARRSAHFIPRRSRRGLYSTTEIADGLGIRPTELGKLTSHLKTSQHGALHLATGLNSEAGVDQWLWNEAGREAVLQEFGIFRSAQEVGP